jgi:hypothetical protein
MTEQELRALVREAIAKTRGAGVAGQVAQARGGIDAGQPLGAHLSHAMFVIPTGSDADGPCIIEPSVACNHCGYCKSYGH